MTTNILTFPLIGNYGGMLQAFSIYEKVSTICPNIILLDGEIMDASLKSKNKIDYLLKKIKYFMWNLSHNIFSFELPIHKKIKLASIFKNNHIKHTHTFDYKNKSDSLYLSGKFIVGSDQIWRCSYCKGFTDVSTYFLDFTTTLQRNRSISYAASFGADDWEGTPEETKKCGRLLREFKAVSVREHSGVKICKDVFGVDAVQMPDPTLLLHPEDYGRIIEMEKTWLPHGKYIASYVLDETGEKKNLLQKSAESLALQLQHLMPHTTAKKRRDRFPISVPQWLRLIRDCEYFITDSFHGCVFAIIFNKPFVCLGNEGRGNARFDTLLSTFRLEDRMLTLATPEEIHRVLHTPIDWECVNAIHDTERERGINFLKENLL